MMVPLNIDVILIDHHIPLKPMVGMSAIDKGILSALKKIETIGGAKVLPIPLNASTVSISKHINTCENAIANI